MNFAENQKQTTITVKTKDDTLVEKNETFNITLSDPSPNADISNPTATGTILNNDKIKLTLATDTYHEKPKVGSGDDNYTKANTKGEVVINVSDLPKNVAWQYNLNDGAGWQDGTPQGSKTTSTFTIKDPSNTSWQGKKYNVSARIKEGQDYDVNSTKGTLGLTIDNKARVPTATSYEKGKLVGYVEPGALVFNDNKISNGKLDRGEEWVKADESGRFELPVAGLKDYNDYLIQGSRKEWDKIQANLGTIDKAGNTIHKDNQGRLYYFDGVGLNGYDYFEKSDRQGLPATRTHKLSNASDIVLTNNISKGTYEFNDGDDSLYVTSAGLAAGGTLIDMGPGQDYLSINKGMDNWASVKMGDGNDIFELAQTGSYIGLNASVDLGSGNDKLISKATKDMFTTNAKGLDGGSGMDTVEFNGGANQPLAKISRVEIYDLTRGNNKISLTKADLLRNAGTFIDDEAKSHHGIMIKGDAGDKVDWHGSTTSQREVDAPTITNKDTDDKTHISGKAEPNAQVTITGANGETVATVTADGEGNYSTQVSVRPTGEQLTATVPNKVSFGGVNYKIYIDDAKNELLVQDNGIQVI